MKLFTLIILFITVTLNCFSQTPTVTSFTPTSAATGRTVTITGTNFTSTTSVTFGGTPASSFSIVSATQITAVVGSGTSGSIVVTRASGSGSKTGFYYLPLSGIITDFAGFWSTTTASPNTTVPITSHNLLAFTYNSVTYSTGANDATLSSNAVTYTSGNFKAIPVAGIAGNSGTGGSTYIALAKSVDGNSSAGDPSTVSNYTIKKVLTDGINGLDLGTGITNLPTSAVLTYNIGNIITSKISDAEPDIIITQIADPSTGNDVFEFIDASGTVVGNTVTQDMTLLNPLGTYGLDLFTLTPNTSYNTASVYANYQSNVTRQIRLVAFKLSDFGITSGNASSIRGLKIIPSGNSDYAFIAYNANALNLPPSVSQDAGATNTSVCAAGTANLAVIANAAGGGTLSYTWQRSTDGGTTWTTVTDGGNVSGATTNKLSISSPTNNNQYRVIVSESGSALTSTSDVFTITIIAPTPPTAVTLSGTGNTCLNSAVTITSTVTGGSNLYYQWQTNASGSYVNIANANLDNYQPPVNVTGSISYQLVVSSGNGCSAITSSPKTITVSTPSVGGSVSGTATACTGSNSTTFTLSGNTGSVIKWQSSTDNFTTTTDVANTTTTLTATNLTVTTKYRAVVQSGACAAANSVAGTVTVTSANVGGSVSGSATVCTGTNSTTLTLSGNTGSVIKWQSSTDNFASVVNDITNTTSTLTATNLMATTQYRAVVQSGACPAANSSAATVTVNPASVGGSVSGSAPVCTGTNSTSLTLSGNTGSIIKWQSSTDNFASVINDIANTTNTLTATNLTATTQYRSVIQSGVCAAANSSTATVTVDPASVGGSVSGSTTVCTGTNSTTLTLSGNTGSVVKWQSSTDNFATIINDIANVTTTLTATNLTANMQYRAVVQSGACTIAYSATATINITQSVGGNVAGSARVCNGSNSTTLTLSGNTGSVIKWQSSTDNFTTDISDIANTTNSLTINNLSATTKYRAVVQTGTCATDFSSAARIRVVSPGGWVGGLSGDWNDPANWCGGLPPSTADVVVPANTTVYIQNVNDTVHSIYISNNGSIVLQNGYTLYIGAGGSFTNNGTFDGSASTGKVSFLGDGTITGTTTFQNIETYGALDFGASSTINGNFTLQNGGSVTGNAPLYTCPSSNLIYNTGGTYNRSMEWLPVSSGKGYPSNVTVQNNTVINFPVGGDGFICNDLTVDAGSSLDQSYSSASAPLSVGRHVTIDGTLSLGSAFGGDISLGGNWTRNEGGIFNNNQRLVVFTGSGNSVITAPESGARDENGAFGGETFYDVNFAKTITSAVVALGSPISVINELKFTSGIFDLANSDVTMVSNISGTAHVAPLPTSGGIVTDVAINYGSVADTGTGRFVIQHFLNIGTDPASRRWHFLTVPFETTDAPTINSAWQEGVSNASKNAPVDPWPGFGTTITKSKIYDSTDGYDQGSTNNPSLYYFNGTDWGTLAATNTQPITDYPGYMLFVRGSRNIVVSTPNINANPTTLEPKGKLNIGDMGKQLTAGFQLLSNPYPADINFNNTAFNNYTIGGITYNTTPGSADGLGITYYIWDPLTDGSEGVGKFISCSSNGDGTFTVTSNNGGIPTDGTIPAGVAFMMTSDDNSGSLTMHEADKLTSSFAVSRPAAPSKLVSKLVTNLYSGEGANAKLADGVINAYADYNNAVDGQDARYLSTFHTNESLSILRNGISLSIERRNNINADDTIFFAIKNLKTANYQLHFEPSNFDPSLSAVLEDKFTKISTPVNITGNTDFSFSITDDINSSASDRFRIVFRPAATLPVTFRDVKAYQQNNSIAVQWTIENQSNIIKYEVEKSVNGITFTNVNTVLASSDKQSVATYNWLDANALTGDNFYRIKYFNSDGSYAYSKIVNVAIGSIKSFIAIYPNPVTDGNVTLQLNNIPAGNYTVRILNSLGKVMSKSAITHSGGNASQTFSIGHLINGSYQLEMTGADKKVKSVQLIVHTK